MPIATEQDHVRHPLNTLLGTKANVRLLRLLAEEIDGSIGAPDAADQTGLTAAGARRALKSLTRTGVVRQLGGGRSQRFTLDREHELAPAIAQLFRLERARYDRLLQALRSQLARFTEVRAAWIEELPGRPGSPLHISVVAPATALSSLARDLRGRLLELEQEFELTIEIHMFSPSEDPARPSDQVILLAGYMPSEIPRGVGVTGHEGRDDRAARMARAIAKIMETDPSLRRRAEKHVHLLLESDRGSASHDLREWRDVLSHYSDSRLAELLIADTPRSTRLRQSSPFFAVLNPTERDLVLDAIGAN